LRIAAFAGTGKTTTLLAVARTLKHRRIRYIVFNRAQQTIASDRFATMGLDNVRVTTAHGLAWGQFGAARYKGRIEKNDGVLVHSWIHFLHAKGALKGFHADVRPAIARGIVRTIKRFIASSDRRISDEHVPDDYGGNRELIVRLASRMWKSIEIDTSLKVSHDVYLKGWQLQGTPIPSADVVLYDEAQDCTPAMLAVVENTPNLQRLYVGDSHQQIYEFRGAVNALESLDLEMLPLTETWRFGHEIAAAANVLLRVKGEKLSIRPGMARDGHVALGYPKRVSDVVLARTNMGLVERALDLIGEGRRPFIRGGTDPATGVAGNGTNELIGGILDAYHLWKGDARPRNAGFAIFESWDDFKVASEEDGGQSYRPYVRIVEQYEDKVPSVVARLRDRSAKTEQESDVILSTVHRFKGEEKPVVALADDFPGFVTRDYKGRSRYDENEVHIAYVAVTRAQRELWMGGAYDTLSAAVRAHASLEFPITKPKEERRPSLIVGMKRLADKVAAPLRLAPMRRRAPQPPKPQSFGEYTAGSVWRHSVYGIVSIISANAQTMIVQLVSGEEKHLATAATIPKLKRNVP
jgi:hypothetical protein